ncbi:MAG: hypothetical protein J6W06_10125 [Bacteroidales bacterium]|nr:hypothetical protein [Bacteroidales bacterium]
MNIRTLSYLLTCLLLFFVASCSPKANETENADEIAVADTVGNDSIAAVSVAEPEPEPVFITPDLAFMEVHGHVKSVEYAGGRKAVFDEKGNLVDYATEYSGENKVMIGRDDDGYIISTYDGPGGSESFDYDKENVRLVLTAAGDGAYYSECHIEYDAEGNVVRYNFVDEDMAEETKDEWSMDVEIVSKDEQGNWTELKTGDATVKRNIIYYK